MKSSEFWNGKEIGRFPTPVHNFGALPSCYGCRDGNEKSWNCSARYHLLHLKPQAWRCPQAHSWSYPLEIDRFWKKGTCKWLPADCNGIRLFITKRLAHKFNPRLHTRFKRFHRKEQCTLLVTWSALEKNRMFIFALTRTTGKWRWSSLVLVEPHLEISKTSEIIMVNVEQQAGFISHDWLQSRNLLLWKVKAS